MSTSGIVSATIGNEVEILPANFVRGSKITEITIPNSVTSIGNYAFYGCSGLTSVTMPNSVTSIGNSAFYGCSGLTSVTIPNSVTSIGYSAFKGCSGLKTVNWNVKNCADFPSGSSPFSGLTGINTFSFGNEVQNIPAYLCYGLSGLTSVTIPNSLNSIGNSAFGDCNNIQDLIWNAKNCTSMGDMPKTNISSVMIGDGVEILPDNFVENSKVTTVTIPNSVTSIGTSAFNGCSGLTIITVPSNVATIGDSAFSNCSGLKAVNWNVQSCNDFASAEKAPFKGSTGVNSFNFGNEVQKISSYLCNELTGLNYVTIPNSVTSIGASAFNGCTGLITITIPSNVTTIGDFAFNNCNGLNVVNWNARNCPDFESADKAPFNGLAGINVMSFGNGVEKIPAYLCNRMGGLKAVTIPNSVMSLGQSAFNGCSGLQSITIPSSVVLVGDAVFQNCSSLKAVNWNAKNCPDFASADKAPFNGLTEINTFNFGNEVERIPAYLCNGLSKISSISLGNAVNSIGTSAFEECRGFMGLEFPNSIISIGQKAFYNCRGLLSITFPTSVSYIGEQAFANCTDLDNIYSYPNPANVALGDDVFYEVPKYTCVLHVIPDYFEAYKKASQWKTFFNIIDDLAGVEGVEVDASTKEVEGYYDLNGIRLEEPISGQVNIVRYKDGTSQKIVN